jgi:hypothetical protein
MIPGTAFFLEPYASCSRPKLQVSAVVCGGHLSVDFLQCSFWNFLLADLTALLAFLYLVRVRPPEV